MAEYIEREKLPKRKEYWDDDFGAGWDACLDAIESIPAADVRPVVRGRWIKPTRVPDSMLDECSVCGFDCGAYTFNYCPNCGAKMGGEEE